MIISAGNNETFSFATPIGVGLIESAANLTRLCLFDPPKYLLFVGSAGSYGTYNIFDIVESKVATQIEIGFIEKKSYSPIDNVISSEENQLQKQIVVNSSNYITTDSAIANKYLTLGIDIENMEFFSVMKVAQMFNIPCGGMFVITNYCNTNAHADFTSNHSVAIQLLTTTLQQKGFIA